MTEADWQTQVLDLARLYGWRVAHFRPARTEHGWRTPVAADGKGWPDLVLVHPDKGVIFAELKTDRGRLSDDQKAWIDLLDAAGAAVHVWKPSDFDQVQEVLRG